MMVTPADLLVIAFVLARVPSARLRAFGCSLLMPPRGKAVACVEGGEDSRESHFRPTCGLRRTKLSRELEDSLLGVDVLLLFNGGELRLALETLQINELLRFFDNGRPHVSL
jgi:hypothetical protein